MSIVRNYETYTGELVATTPQFSNSCNNRLLRLLLNVNWDNILDTNDLYTRLQTCLTYIKTTYNIPSLNVNYILRENENNRKTSIFKYDTIIFRLEYDLLEYPADGKFLVAYFHVDDTITADAYDYVSGINIRLLTADQYEALFR